MPRTALVLYLAFLGVAFGWRGWLQYRRTGDHGFRGLSGRPGSAEWWGGALFTTGGLVALAAPVAQLAGWVRPLAAAAERPALHALGLLLALGGFALTLAAQIQMGASWRVGVDAGERTELITHGLFARVRNPIYTAMLLALSGLALLVPNALALAGCLLTWAGLELHVRRVEEPYLRRVHGEGYARYERAVGRFLPGLGRAR